MEDLNKLQNSDYYVFYQVSSVVSYTSLGAFDDLFSLVSRA